MFLPTVLFSYGRAHIISHFLRFEISTTSPRPRLFLQLLASYFSCIMPFAKFLVFLLRLFLPSVQNVLLAFQCMTILNCFFIFISVFLECSAKSSTLEAHAIYKLYIFSSALTSCCCHSPLIPQFVLLTSFITYFFSCFCLSFGVSNCVSLCISIPA